MKCLALAVAALLATTAVNAQIYQWKDGDGRTVISDKPPLGGARSSRTIEAEAPTAKSAPQKTLADREMDFRKRQQDAKDKADKAQKEQLAASEKKENCENTRRNLETLESGEGISLRNDKGERYPMDDAQRQQEIAKARQAAQTYCK